MGVVVLGYELWTSPTTGHRRKGTRLEELQALVDVGVTARAIAEPLGCCPADACPAAMKVLLRKRGFDVAGVMRGKDGPIIGWIQQADLEDGSIDKYLKNFSVNHLISDSTPISVVMDILENRSFAFVLRGKSVKDIVTHADLNKPPVRIFLFSIISLLEMHLTFWIRKYFNDTSIKSMLSEKRVSKALHFKNEQSKRQQIFWNC